MSSIGSSVSSLKGAGKAVAGIDEVGPCSTREGVWVWVVLDSSLKKMR